MKRNVLKKITALLLAVIVAVGTLPACLCSAKKAVTPVIVVSGMGSFPLYLKGEDGQEKQVFGPAAADILSALAKCIVPLGKDVVNNDYSDLSDITQAVYGIFDSIACNPNGSSKYPVYTKTFSKSVDNYPDDFLNSEQDDDEIGIVKGMIKEYGGENVYYFNYDWRLDPLTHADGLAKLINSVLKEKKCEKVALVPASMGGCVVMSYIYKYGTDKLQRVVMAETAFQGVSLVGELFGKRLTVTTDMLLEYFYTFYQTDGFLYQTLLGMLASVIDLGGVNVKATLDKFFRSVVETVREPAYADIILKSFANMPGMWSLVPSTEYSSAKKAMFPGGMNKTLAGKADKYQNYVQKKAKSLLKAGFENGVDFRIVASYGFVGFPAVSTSYAQTDCLIDTAFESGGATCADRGQTLGEDYAPKSPVCKNAKHSHLSSDGIIDASTCMYPEKTWFVKYNRHVGHKFGTEANDLIVWLAGQDGDVTVYTNEKYPQFTALELFTGKLVSLTGEEGKKGADDGMSDFASRLVIFIRGIILFLKSLFTK